MKQPHMVRLLTRTVYMFLQLQTWPFFDLGDVHLQAMWHEIHSDWPEHVGAS